jgi:hypothetical protein
MASFTPRPLYSRDKSPRFPFDRRLGGPQRRSGRKLEKWSVKMWTGFVWLRIGTSDRLLSTGTLGFHEVKVKLPLCFSLTEHHAMKAYWGCGGIASRIIDLRH